MQKKSNWGGGGGEEGILAGIGTVLLSGRNANIPGYVYRCDWEILQECAEMFNLKDRSATGTCSMN